MNRYDVSFVLMEVGEIGVYSSLLHRKRVAALGMIEMIHLAFSWMDGLHAISLGPLWRGTYAIKL